MRILEEMSTLILLYIAVIEVLAIFIDADQGLKDYK